MLVVDEKIVTRPSWTKYDALIKHYADEFAVPWQWIKAILLCESTLGENSRVKQGHVSEDGKSWGIAQFRIETARWVYGEPLLISDLLDDEFSIKLCAKYISYLSGRFEKDSRKVIMSYNQGQGNTAKGKVDEPYFTKWCAWMDLISLSEATKT